jgi:hypothetical protein
MKRQAQTTPAFSQKDVFFEKIDSEPLGSQERFFSRIGLENGPLAECQKETPNTRQPTVPLRGGSL